MKYQKPNLKINYNNENKLGYCSNGSNAQQSLSSYLCNDGNSPGHEICESGQDNLTAYEDCTIGNSVTYPNNCNSGSNPD